MTERQAFGRASEKRAENFLRTKKHRILEKNYRTRQCEVDIVSLSPEGILVFTEVRSKHDCRYGHPVETVDARKQARVRAAARQFLYEHAKYRDFACRFDVITVVGEGRDALLEYFPDAF